MKNTLNTPRKKASSYPCKTIWFENEELFLDFEEEYLNNVSVMIKTVRKHYLCLLNFVIDLKLLSWLAS